MDHFHGNSHQLCILSAECTIGIVLGVECANHYGNKV